MRALLDTHSFLWWILDDSRLSLVVRKIMGESELFLSAASAWEIMIKRRLGRIKLPRRADSFILNQIEQNEIRSLPIQMSHALQVYRLPDHHRDPFDRIIIAQAQVENMPILTSDAQISRYHVRTLW